MFNAKLLLLAGSWLLLSVPASAQERGPEQTRGDRFLARLCSTDRQPPRVAQRLDRMSERLSLTDAQKGLLKDVQDMREKARADATAGLCSAKPDMTTFKGILDFRERTLEMRLSVAKTVRPKLDAFYNGLDDKQKTAFLEPMERARGDRDAGQGMDRSRGADRGRDRGEGRDRFRNSDRFDDRQDDRARDGDYRDRRDYRSDDRYGRGRDNGNDVRRDESDGAYGRRGDRFSRGYPERDSEQDFGNDNDRMHGGRDDRRGRDRRSYRPDYDENDD